MNVKIIKISKAVLLYVAALIILYIGAFYCKWLPSQNSLLDFSNYMIGIFAPITTIATVYITYLVYKLNSDETKIELYFSKIVELIFNISEDFAELNKDSLNSYKGKDLKNKIKQQVILARYYLKRFPDKDCPIDELDKVLNHIFFDPYNGEYYNRLSNVFRSFCFYVNQDSQRPISCIKDDNGNITLVQE